MFARIRAAFRAWWAARAARTPAVLVDQYIGRRGRRRVVPLSARVVARMMPAGVAGRHRGGSVVARARRSARVVAGARPTSRGPKASKPERTRGAHRQGRPGTNRKLTENIMKRRRRKDDTFAGQRARGEQRLWDRMNHPDFAGDF